MPREERHPSRRAGTIALVLPLAGGVWVVCELFFIWMVLSADDFPQCAELRPNEALLVSVGVGAVVLALLAFTLVARPRTRLWGYGCVAGQLPLGLLWRDLDGGAASCLIG